MLSNLLAIMAITIYNQMYGAIYLLFGYKHIKVEPNDEYNRMSWNGICCTYFIYGNRQALWDEARNIHILLLHPFIIGT